MFRSFATRTHRALLAAAGALVVASSATGCARNPVTGDRELSLVSRDQEIQLGRQAAQDVVQSIGLVKDDALQAYVQRLGTRLAEKSQRPDLPWTFRVVDDPTPNAFALPGGFVFITRGLMNLMDTEAELASVLGHEIGHITAKHSVQMISRQQLAQIGLGVGAILAPETVGQFGDLLGGGLQLLFLKYGRDAERQADELGFDYARTQGYDVRAMADVFEQLRRVGEKSGQSPLPSWLATHPYPEERIRAVQERVAGLQEPLDRATLGRAEYLGQIDGLVYGDDPRAGFFQGGVFYHPELRFRFAFPQGFRTQNLPQAVVGVSQQQDAVAQLTMAQGSATQAAQQFAAQQGLRTGQAARRTVNGVPAVIVPFQAQTQQGVLQGLAGFLEYGGRTYQLLTYAPAARYPQYDQLFQQIIGSFAPVSDPSVLNAQPQRIDIVRLERNMNLSEFNRLYPSVVPLEELALINQVTDPSAVIAAGTLVKRVVRGDVQR